MNSKKKLFTLAALALMLASCSNNETPIDETKDTPITIQSAGVAELSTRVITDDNKLVGTEDDRYETISVFITGGSEENYKANNMMWEHDGTDWTSEQTVLYEGAASKQQIYACSPYSHDAASGSVTVTADYQIDWLVATQTPLTSNNVNLTMTHALTKLVLDPTFGDEVKNETFSSVKVGGMYASGKLNISNNTWDLGDTPATTELTMTDNKELLVIPMSNCTSFPISITMADNRTFKADVRLDEVGNQLLAGTQYTIKLQIGQDKIIIERISMDDIDYPFEEGWSADNEDDLM